MATGWLRNINGKFRNKLQDASVEVMPEGSFVESVMISSKRAEWETYFNCKILNAKVNLCGTKRSRPVGTSDSAQKRRAIEEGISSGGGSVLTGGVFTASGQQQQSSQSSAATRELIGADRQPDSREFQS